MPDPDPTTAESALPRAFLVVRDEDLTGISGTGDVAEGVVFSDGYGVTHWLDQPPAHEAKTEVWHRPAGTEPFLRISGHGGSTRVVWADSPEAAAGEVAEALAKTAAAKAGARTMSCGHDLIDRCASCHDGERQARQELAEVYDQLTAAIARDRQPYPTRWAYEQACRARDTHKERADAAQAELDQYRDGEKPPPADQREQLVTPLVIATSHAVERARALADRWSAAQGDDAAAVRAAAVELREELDGPQTDRPADQATAARSRR